MSSCGGERQYDPPGMKTAIEEIRNGSGRCVTACTTARGQTSG